MSGESVKVLLQAAADDNVTELTQKLSKTTVSTQRESLLVACKRESLNYMSEILRLLPHLAYIKDDNGSTVLHNLVDYKLPVSIIEALIKRHPDGPKLCTQTDYEFITPIHMTAKQGRMDLLKALIGACGSDSLSRVTCLHQTALHLALENGQIGCFDFMMEELLKDDDDGQLSKSLRVLNLKDHNGNTVLHISIAKKQTLISGYLLADNPKKRPLVEVDIKNNLGLTALQIHDQNSPERDERHIRQLLIRAEPKDHHPVKVVASMEISHNISETSKMTSLTAKSLIMAAMSLIAAMTFGSLSFYRGIYTAGAQPVSPNANLFTPNLLPSGFYYLTVATATFVVCMLTTLLLLWSVHSQWSTIFRAIGLFLSSSTQILFGLMVSELIPDFSVTTFGTHRISSLYLLGFYVVALLLVFFFTFVFITKLILITVSKVSDD